MADANPQSDGLSFEDAVIDRDAEGRRVPKPVYIEEFDDTVECKPLNKAGRQKYIQPLAETAAVGEALAEGDLDADDLEDEDLEGVGLTDELIAECLEEHYLNRSGEPNPPLLEWYNRGLPEGETADSLDAEFVSEHLYPEAADGLFYGPLLATGMDDLVAALRGTLDPDDAEGNR